MMLIFESKRHIFGRDFTKCIIEPNKLQLFPRYINNEKITDSRKGTFRDYYDWVLQMDEIQENAEKRDNLIFLDDWQLYSGMWKFYTVL